jgi:hypothetical protein
VSNATDVAKGAASVVLTDEGVPGIVALVEQSRAVNQRILTWIINNVPGSSLLLATLVAAPFRVCGGRRLHPPPLRTRDTSLADWQRGAIDVECQLWASTNVAA